MSVRAALWRVHRWVGLACAAPFLVLTLTGMAMLVDHSIGFGATPRLDHAIRDAAGIDRALSEIARERPDLKPGLILAGIDDCHAWTVSLKGRGGAPLAADFDPETGKLLGFRPAGSNLGETLLAIHNSLALGSAGKIVILLTAAGLVLLSVSGFAIMRRRWRVLMASPIGGRSPLTRLHHWAGLVGLALVVLWATTGFFLLGVKSLGGGRSGGPPAAAVSAPAASAPLAPMLARIAAHHPGKEIQGIVPGAGKRPTMVMMLDRDAPPWSKSATLAFDSISGIALPARPAPGFIKVMVAAKSLHTGLWDGWRLRTFYLVGACLPLILAISGPWLWLRRRSRSRPKAASQ